MTDGPAQILKLYNIRGYDVTFLRDFRRYPYAMTICQSGKQDPIAVGREKQDGAAIENGIALSLPARR